MQIIFCLSLYSTFISQNQISTIALLIINYEIANYPTYTLVQNNQIFQYKSSDSKIKILWTLYMSILVELTLPVQFPSLKQSNSSNLHMLSQEDLREAKTVKF